MILIILFGNSIHIQHHCFYSNELFYLFILVNLVMFCWSLLQTMYAAECKAM